MLTTDGFLTDKAAYWLATAVYIGTTIVSVYLAWKCRDSFTGIATEKDARTGLSGSPAQTSFSRVAGLIGAAYLAAFCWGFGLYLLTKMWVDPEEIKKVVPDVTRFILAGASMFTPYAFNQLSQILGNRLTSSSANFGNRPPPLIGPPPNHM
jgi:hypothetical protein